VGLILIRIGGDDDIRIWANCYLSDRELTVFVEVFNTFEPSSLSIEGSWVDLDESDSDTGSGSESGSESGSDSESGDNVVGVECVTQENNLAGVGNGISSHNDVGDDNIAGDGSLAGEGTRSQYDATEDNLDGEGNLAGVDKGKGVHLSDAEGNKDTEYSTDYYDEFFDSDYDMKDASSEDDDALFFDHVDASANGESESESIDSDNEDVVANPDKLDDLVDSENEAEVETPVFNPELIFDPVFELGMVFATKQEFRKAIQSHSIKTKRTLKTIKNDKIRVYVRCDDEGCKWRCNLLQMKGQCSYQIREYNPTHTCHGSFNVKNTKSKWLSERYISNFQTDPKRSVKGWRFDVIHELNVNISKDQAYRAKRRAMN
ncbi:Unknown protein, partial [Striga hermonthica]